MDYQFHATVREVTKRRNGKLEIQNEEIGNRESLTTTSDAETSYSYHLKGRSV